MRKESDLSPYLVHLATRERVDAVPANLRYLVPAMAHCIAEGMGGQGYWETLDDAERRGMVNTAAALLHEAHKRASEDKHAST